MGVLYISLYLIRRVGPVDPQIRRLWLWR